MNSDRTTVNVDKRTHTAGNHIKEEYNDTWLEVVDFYVKYRPIIDDLESGEVPHEDIDSQGIKRYINECITDVEGLVNSHHDIIMDELNANDSELTEEDVEAIVSREIEKNVHERARQL